MSITPLSLNEIVALKKIFKKNNWSIKGLIENYFRFSIKKNKLLILSLKFPVTLPVRLNIPFEIGTFRISIAFKFWNVTENFNNFLVQLIFLLKNLASQVSIEHNFPIKEKKNQFLQILNAILPDLIKDENERAWLNRIRISLMNKREQFQNFDSALIKDLVKTLNSSGLKASFEQPWELKKGLPKMRTSETLFFSNNEPFDEFFIIEKGYYSYFKDLEYNKFYIRSFFETYTPYILYGLFGNNPDFNYMEYIENWIKFARLILNSILEILIKLNPNQNDFIQFNPQRELDSNLNNFEEGENNFPFSALHYESQIAKELYPLHNNLFNIPPEDFEVIEYIHRYTEAEDLIKNYRFNDATIILNESLKVFNKHRQKKIVVSILLLLRKIASLLNQKTISINYLKTALGVAKSGEIPIEYIINIHYKLGRTYYQLKEFENARNHFSILIKFLENQEHKLTGKNYLAMGYLYMGLIEYERNKVSESRSFFKKALQLTENSPKVKLSFHLLRAIQFKSRGNVSQAYKFIKTGLENINLDEIEGYTEDIKNIIIDMYLEGSEFFIHQRKDIRRATNFLSNVSNFITVKTIPGLQRSIRWNLLMSDFFNFLVKNRDKYTMYLKKAQKLKGRLREIGVSE
ncbi:MAG: tetratricopeptide repeat protein [Promethearchaeota archaeon]